MSEAGRGAGGGGGGGLFGEPGEGEGGGGTSPPPFSWCLGGGEWYVPPSLAVCVCWRGGVVVRPSPPCEQEGVWQ